MLDFCIWDNKNITKSASVAKRHIVMKHLSPSLFNSGQFRNIFGVQFSLSVQGNSERTKMLT